ncbi:aldehyde dehydrogenase (NAD+) [Monoraphidium neglectum]|uniref:Aldehyde dehydrogenase (NAD+) n=1 Tax=Monoraphidium neglectum TaxID=145388 RepID=A0A0D2NRS5_9CHLO|nr:aldehyde dehydrogenase (NAD+) [Monoraphidium neglectum]KIZ06991.1 aldehyde dehydrogenase (NAD+) [Monoraphidium neglectum]|eukprot:XP_013906010.1 aldehyde dehydrogenase (NAD+) [Monoraphidium neglectum]
MDGPYWAYTHRKPLGVVGAIVPFNFPLAMAAMKLAPALACGNTLVAEQTPLASLLLGQLTLEAGLPPGVVNILSGRGRVAGAALAGHPGVDKVVFTGSTEVGRLVGATAGRNLKPCTLELGGKSPLIVEPDADLDLAVSTAQDANFFHQGQCCTAGSWVFVHEAVYDEFVARSVHAAQHRSVGNPFDEAVQQGPQVSRAQFDKVLGYINTGHKEGAHLVAGGSRIGNKGFFVEPTVFTGVRDDMAIARDEIFGPVQSIMRYRTLDEVIRRANGTHYGLAAGIFSSNLNTVNKLTRALRAGMVWVNCYSVGDSSIPIGGYKDSGMGREKGEDALQHYTQVKAVVQPLRGAAWTAPSKIDYESLAFEALQDVPRKLLIGGKWTDAADRRSIAVFDPRTEAHLIHVAAAGEADVDAAVAAARRAFDEGPWPRMSAKASAGGTERGRVLYRLADLIEQHADELAALETLDVGMPITFSQGLEVPQTVDIFRYYAGWADKIHGKTIPVDGPYWAYTLREPLGVIGQIVPWNFPLIMAAWKLAPALACGNTCVLKVAEQTPLVSLRLGQLALEAGLPPGAVNILPGIGEVAGAALVRHPGIDKVVFTGSTEVGRLVAEAAGRNLKPCTLELGGKSPLIVEADADLGLAVSTAQDAVFFHQGQICCAGSRVFVHEGVYDEFVARSAQAAQHRPVGNPFEAEVLQGPQVDRAQFDKAMRYIDLGRTEGARLAAGGRRGFFVEPTVFTGVRDDMAIAREEIFGPVQSIMSYKSLDEVIRRANATPYGLAAGVFSSNLDTVNTLARALKAGTVWVNCFTVMDSAVPFGGYKDSGMGREKGEDALQHYTQVKAVVQPLKGAAWM